MKKVSSTSATLIFAAELNPKNAPEWNKHQTATNGIQFSSNFQLLRFQKSYVVNLEKTTEYIKSEGGYVIIEGVHKIPVSADKLQELNIRLKEIMKIL